MKKEVLIFLLVISLGANLVLGVSMKLSMDPVETEPRKVQEAPAEEKPTDATINWVDVILPTLPHETQAVQTQSPETIPQTEPETAPATEPEVQFSLQEFKDLDNTLITYGPGTATGGNPAPYAQGAQDQYGKYGAHFIEDADGAIYLTFDCGYEYFLDGKPVTAMILDTLKEKDVKAVFFITGSYARNNPDLVRRIIDEGHILGNHSSDHKSMPSLDLSGMEAQIMSLHDYVKNTFDYSMKFFRPPSGEFSVQSLAATQKLGYETVHWSFAYADWNPDNQPDPDEALKKILSCHHDGAIYLLHAVSATNAQVLGDVIDGLRELGYRLELLP